MRFPRWIFAALMVGACASAPDLTTRQSLFDLQHRYNTLGAVVLHYIQQPLCGDVDLTIACANVEIVWALQRVDREVYNVLLAAEAARHTADAALYLQLTEAALTRLRAAIAQYAITETL